MNASMTRSWIRIESWLEIHAPKTFAALGPPASAKQIKAAEEAIGLTFPQALIESLLRHAGTNHTDLLPLCWLNTPTEIVDEWQMMTNIWHEQVDDAECPSDLDHDADEYGPWWHPQWIPFASDGCGSGLVIDQRDNGHTGRIGECLKVDGGLFKAEEMWASLPAHLGHLAHCLETGAMFGCWTATVEGGQLDWDI